MGAGDFDMESQGGDTEMLFSEKSVRRGFIRKVYSIISMQLLLTVGVIVVFKTNADVQRALSPERNSGIFWGVFITCFVLVLSIIIAMACVRTLRVSFPLNFILLALFTAAESVMLGMVCIPYDDDVVYIAGGATAGIVIVLTIFAFQTKIDFTMCGGVLVCVLFVFIIFGFIMAFFPYNNIANIAYSAVGVLIFSIYLVYDTQMMMGGNHKYAVSPEEYIFAAIAIYLDIINIFLYLLRIVGAAKK